MAAMTAKGLIADAKQRMHTSLETVRRELSAMRTGRASLSMLDNVRVDYYGNPTPLNQVGTLSTPDPTLITIQPWDPKILPLVEKAIRTSDLDLNPQNDGKIIRLTVPMLSEEQRKKLVGRLKEIAEQAKVALRNTRRDANKHLDDAKDLTDDQVEKAKESVQNLLKQSEGDVEKTLATKTKEIMES